MVDVNAIIQQQAAQATQTVLAGFEGRVAALETQGGQGASEEIALLKTKVAALEGTVGDALTKEAPVLVADAAAAGTAVLTNLERDPLTQRDAALVVIAGAVVIVVAVVIAYLCGNPYAGKIIAGVPLTGGGLVLWLSRVEGLALPKIGPKAPGA